MKAILLAMKPEHALNIIERRKTSEIRKNVFKDFVGWVYVYVTKGKPYLKYDWYSGYFTMPNKNDRVEKVLNGTIPFRFWFDEYEEIEYETIDDYSGALEDVCMYNQKYEQIVKQSCLDYEIMKEYANGRDLYAWHIKKPEMFDKPMQLSEFYRGTFYETPFKLSKLKKGEYIDKGKWLDMATVKRAPQSWQYVWVKE